MRSRSWLVVGSLGVILAACRSDTEPEPVEASQIGSAGVGGSPWHALPSCPGETIDQTLSQSVPCLAGTGGPAGAGGAQSSTGAGGASGEGGEAGGCSPDREPPRGLSKDVSLWPPDGSMHTVTIADCVQVLDACDPAPRAWFTSVASDEDGSLRGAAGGAFEVIDCQTVRVRAERAATGDGRVYSLGWEASDASGNVSHGTCRVLVPLDPSTEAVLTTDGDGKTLFVDGCDWPGLRR